MSEKTHERLETAAAAMAESLEPRRLLAGIEAGVLVARGTGSGDLISIRRSASDDVIVTTNGVNQTFDMDDFTGVRLEGLGGADRLTVVDPLTRPVVRAVTLDGGAGDDTFVTSTGSETIQGGDGQDTVDYSARSSRLEFSFRPDHLDQPQFGAPYHMTSGGETDVFGFDVEVYVGGSAGDRYTYGGESPGGVLVSSVLTFDGRGGDDAFGDLGEFDPGYIVLGGDGNDDIGVAESPDFMVSGGAGNDTFEYERNQPSPTTFSPGSGVDTLIFAFLSVTNLGFDMRPYPGLENVSWVSDLEPQFTVIGNDLPNRIDAGSGGNQPITIQGMGGNDTLIGGDGPDLLLGGEGNDSIAGNDGDDTIDGGAGNDTVDGGVGNDTLISAEVTPAAPAIRILNRILTADGSWGQERLAIERTLSDDVIVTVNNVSRQFDMDDFDGVLLRGNNGYDVLQILDPIVAGSLVRKVTLDGGNGNDTLLGAASADVLRGGAGGDRLTAFAGNDALFGGIGSDDLNPGPGLDFNDAGDGNDLIMAIDFAGGDTVLGGPGNDEARVDAGDNTSGVERIVG